MKSPAVISDGIKVGDALRRWRLVHDLPASAAAERAGISVPTLRLIERGEAHRVGFGAILGLARVYGVEKLLLDGIEPLNTELGVARAALMNRKRASR